MSCLLFFSYELHYYTLSIFCNSVIKELVLFTIYKDLNMQKKAILYCPYHSLQKFCGFFQPLCVSLFHRAEPGGATLVRTMQRRLTGGYNVKSKNQNTLISGTWHGSHAGNKTACTPSHVACIDVSVVSGDNSHDDA